MQITKEQTAQVEEAIRLSAVIIVLDQGKNPDRAKLGFTQLDYGKLFIRDRWTLFAIARELNCDVSDLLPPPEKPRDQRYPALLEAAEAIQTIIQAQTPDVRAMLALRAAGSSWNRVASLLSGRVIFSLQDDYRAALASIWAQRSAECATLLAYKNDRLTERTVRRSVKTLLLSKRSA